MGGPFLFGGPDLFSGCDLLGGGPPPLGPGSREAGPGEAALFLTLLLFTGCLVSAGAGELEPKDADADAEK